jgi:S-(hydroxymethyl)mycothiol dehydrogenase
VSGTLAARGAVVRERGAPVTIEDLELDPPGPGEVRVAIRASGVCHSDRWAAENGNWGAPFPMLLGHEGAGEVIDVGPGVPHVGPGDPVLLAWAVPCGRCDICTGGRRRRCAHGWRQPPRVRIARTGEPLEGTLSLGTLSTATVVHAAQTIPVPRGSDLSRLCLLGCGVSTGLGAAITTAGVWPGSTVAVIGLGGIGLAALQGALIAGASRVIAIDLVAAKLVQAERLGATDTVDASAVDPVEAVRSLTRGRGVDVAMEATGVAEVVAQAVAMTARAGVTCAIGVPPPGSEVRLAWGEGPAGAAYPNKVSLVVTDGGDPIAEDFTTWIGWALDGRLDLDAMVTREGSLSSEDLTEAFRAMLAGEVVRTVLRPVT